MTFFFNSDMNNTQTFIGICILILFGMGFFCMLLFGRLSLLVSMAHSRVQFQRITYLYRDENVYLSLYDFTCCQDVKQQQTNICQIAISSLIYTLALSQFIRWKPEHPFICRRSARPSGPQPLPYWPLMASTCFPVRAKPS